MNRIIFSFFFFFFYSFCIMVTAYPSACSNNFHFSCFQYLGLWGPPKYEAPWASPQGGDLPSGLSVSLSLYISSFFLKSPEPLTFRLAAGFIVLLPLARNI
jgi:hypothetical protein